MANQWNPADYVTASFSSSGSVCGLPVFSPALPWSSAPLVFVQQFQAMLVDISPGSSGSTNAPPDAAFNSPHPSAGKTPDYSNYYLIGESPKENVGGGQVRWTRTYSQIPASFSDFESYVYAFPGNGPDSRLGDEGSAVVGRLKFTMRVLSRVQNDFFLPGVGPAVDPVTGATLTWPTGTAADIPPVYGMVVCWQYTLGSYDLGGWAYRQDYVVDSTPVNSNVGWLYPTQPSADNYAHMIQDAIVHMWSAGTTVQVLSDSSPVQVVTSGSSAYPASRSGGETHYAGQFIAEDSTLTRWQKSGNIWLRKTRWILAK